MQGTNSNQLTEKRSNAILSERSEEGIPEDLDVALLVGKLMKLNSDLRRGLLTLTAATEDFLGIDARTCRHCGRPVR